MKKRMLMASVLLLVGIAVVLSQGLKQIKALLTGYEEVPVVSTAASGELNLSMRSRREAISAGRIFKATLRSSLVS